MKRPRPGVVAGLLILMAGLAVADGRPATITAVVEQPRAFGYVLGDLIEQRILLQARDQAFEPAALPASERIGAWFERRRTRFEYDSGLRRWLVVDYQIINAPQGVQSVKLPAWRLIAANPAGLVLAVPGWTLTVGPLTATMPLSAAALRGDHPPPRIAREPRVITLEASLAALGLSVGAWLVWWAWSTRRAAARLPFARAWRDMRGVDGREPRAWQALHRAFDRTAGLAIQPTTLPTLFEAAPELAELRTGIEVFFRESSVLFFGGGGVSDGVSPHDLCARLRRIERRYAR